MWMITRQQWMAVVVNRTAGEFDNISDKQVAFATKLTLNDALRRIRAYQDFYKRKWERTTLEYRILSVSAIPADTDVDAL
jgi:hypothetical protein